ncbi:MAG: hypothetical protein H6608_12480 [Flavobacteriales bacterium]|nr:hypothetical protein [Bacteroidota bacterium]MCB9241948.1 hypothetical protein [Flavobacteriales bacterium]
MFNLNMVWPAIYVVDEVGRFWYLVIATIVIETFTIKVFLNYSWAKSSLASVIGNLVSGLIGTFVMMWAMLIWHLLADQFVPDATFDLINWVATYVLMCLGSVFLETLTIKIIFKESIKRLFIPLLIGNVMTYGIIAYSMATHTNKDPKEARTVEVMYAPSPNSFILLDSTRLVVHPAKTEISYDKDSNVLNTGYSLQIPFEKEQSDYFQFTLRLAGSKYSGGIEEHQKQIRLDSLSDVIQVVLEQKNPDPTKGWSEPVVTDTISFVRQSQLP